MASRHYRITLADALAAHDEALKYGGRGGITDLNMIESPSLVHTLATIAPSKTAALLDSVATNHGFTDGNKRTALLLADLLLVRSGYVLVLQDETEIDEAIVAVV